MAFDPRQIAADLASGDQTQPGYINIQVTAVGAAPSGDIALDAYSGLNGKLPRALFVGGAGTLVVVDYLDNEATFTLTAGMVIAVRPKTIKGASTATGIVALF